MIDTVGVIAPMTRKLLSTALAGNDLPYPRIWKRVKTRFGSFRITIDIEAKSMAMELSPSMYLVGHNVFGTNRLDPLIRGVLKLIYDHFQLPFTERDEAFYAEDGAKLPRVDLTGSFLVGSQRNVVDTMEMITAHLLAHGYHIVLHQGHEGIETIYVGKNSKHSTVKFYNKYLEIVAKSKAAGLPYYPELLRYAEKVVRFEVTLRNPSLECHGLKNSKDWSVGKVRTILEAKLLELGFSDPLLAELPESEITNLTSGRRSKYSLWLAGNDLRQHYPAWTFDRDRKIFLEKGLDIARTHDDAEEAVVLSERLSASQMRLTWPKRFVSLGAVHI